MLLVLQSLQKLIRFFHDRQVCGEIRIKHIVCSHLAQSVSQLFDGGFLPGQTKRFAPGCTYGRRDLHDRDLVRIVECLKCVLTVLANMQGIDRTVGDALSAQAAFGFFDVTVLGDVDRRAGSGLLHIPHLQILYLIADLDAAHALDAFVAFPDQREVFVPWNIGYLFLVWQRGDAQVVADLLQLTVAAA